MDQFLTLALNTWILSKLSNTSLDLSTIYFAHFSGCGASFVYSYHSIPERYKLFSGVKGQLQRFHKLISNDRIWPSEQDFEVIFEKSLFVFEISAFKVWN